MKLPPDQLFLTGDQLPVKLLIRNFTETQTGLCRVCVEKAEIIYFPSVTFFSPGCILTVFQHFILVLKLQALLDMAHF